MESNTKAISALLFCIALTALLAVSGVCFLAVIHTEVAANATEPVQGKIYIYQKAGCQQPTLTKESSEIWGSWSRDKYQIFLVPSICEGSYTLMSSTGIEPVGTVTFQQGGIIIEVGSTRVGIK